MKAIKFILIGIILLQFNAINAQVSVTINIGSPPPWGPYGYSGVRFYYLPELETYYDIQSSLFIYSLNGVWIQRAYLPSRYRNYDLYSGYKVVLTDYHGNTPSDHFIAHKKKYAKNYKGSGVQKTNGVKPGNKNSNSKPNKANPNNGKDAGHNTNNKGSNSHGGDKGKK